MVKTFKGHWDHPNGWCLLNELRRRHHNSIFNKFLLKTLLLICHLLHYYACGFRLFLSLAFLIYSLFSNFEYYIEILIQLYLLVMQLVMFLILIVMILCLIKSQAHPIIYPETRVSGCRMLIALHMM